MVFPDTVSRLCTTVQQMGQSTSFGRFTNPRQAKATLPETNIAPENRPGPKRKQSYSNHRFSGAILVSGRVKRYQMHGEKKLQFQQATWIPHCWNGTSSFVLLPAYHNHRLNVFSSKLDNTEIVEYGKNSQPKPPTNSLRAPLRYSSTSNRHFQVHVFFSDKDFVWGFHHLRTAALVSQRSWVWLMFGVRIQKSGFVGHCQQHHL